MDEKSKTTCRICLCFPSKDESKNFKSLFEMHNCSTVSDNITLIADVKIEEDDGLPSKICGECLLELDAAINFKDKCERSNKLLLSVKEDEKENSTTLPTAEIPIPIELVKKEEASGDDIQYEVEYCNDFESETHLTENESATGMKSALKTEESDLAVATITSEQQQPVLKKSRAIDLKLECHDCGGLFKTKCKLRVHWKKVHLLEKLICNYCKQTFKSFYALHKHLKKRPNNCLLASETRIEGIGKSRVFHCRNCNHKTKTSHKLHLHLNIHKGNRPYVCKLCYKTFVQQSTLDSHKELIHKIIKKVIICQFCGQVVMGRQKIQKHLDKHTRSPLQCDICKKMFKTKETLGNHLKCHSGVKAYKCEKCAAAFYNLSSLINHDNIIHSNKRVMYICDICGYKTTKAGALQSHKLKHTNCNISCNVCGRFFSDVEQLASHQKSHTKDKSACLQCNKMFCNERSLRRHIASSAHERKKKLVDNKVVIVKTKKKHASIIDGKNEKVVVEIFPVLTDK